MKTIQLLGIINLDESSRVKNTQDLFEQFKQFINTHESKVSLVLYEQHVHFFEMEDKFLVVAHKESLQDTAYGRMYHGDKNHFFEKIQNISIFKDIDVKKVYNYTLINDKVSKIPSVDKISKRIKL